MGFVRSNLCHARHCLHAVVVADHKLLSVDSNVCRYILEKKFTRPHNEVRTVGSLQIKSQDSFREHMQLYEFKVVRHQIGAVSTPSTCIRAGRIELH